MLPLLEQDVPAHVVVHGPVELLWVPVQRPCGSMIPEIGGTGILQRPTIAPMHHLRLAASRLQWRSVQSRILELELQVQIAQQVHLAVSLNRL